MAKFYTGAEALSSSSNSSVTGSGNSTFGRRVDTFTMSTIAISEKESALPDLALPIGSALPVTNGHVVLEFSPTSTSMPTIEV